MGAITQELRQAGRQRGVTLIRKTIDHKEINFDGDLRKSVTAEVSRGDDSVSLEVGPDAEHAKYVQFGTRPHRAPFDPIKDWARRKLGDESAWFPVWLKIEREGTDPQDFLTGPARLLRRELPGRLEDTIAEHMSS